jgi:hypothetical protein
MKALAIAVLGLFSIPVFAAGPEAQDWVLMTPLTKHVFVYAYVDGTIDQQALDEVVDATKLDRLVWPPNDVENYIRLVDAYCQDPSHATEPLGSAVSHALSASPKYTNGSASNP